MGCKRSILTRSIFFPVFCTVFIFGTDFEKTSVFAAKSRFNDPAKTPSERKRVEEIGQILGAAGLSIFLFSNAYLIHHSSFMPALASGFFPGMMAYGFGGLTDRVLKIPNRVRNKPRIALTIVRSAVMGYCAMRLLRLVYQGY